MRTVIFRTPCYFFVLSTVPSSVHVLAYLRPSLPTPERLFTKLMNATVRRRRWWNGRLPATRTNWSFWRIHSIHIYIFIVVCQYIFFIIIMIIVMAFFFFLFPRFIRFDGCIILNKTLPTVQLMTYTTSPVSCTRRFSFPIPGLRERYNILLARQRKYRKTVIACTYNVIAIMLRAAIIVVLGCKAGH